MMMIAFGISSLFFAILGVFIPLVGIFISGISGFLAWMSAGKGTPLGAAAVIINLINIFLLSPGYLLAVHLEAQYRTPDQSKSFTQKQGIPSPSRCLMKMSFFLTKSTLVFRGLISSVTRQEKVERKTGRNMVKSSFISGGKRSVTISALMELICMVTARTTASTHLHSNLS